MDNVLQTIQAQIKTNETQSRALAQQIRDLKKLGPETALERQKLYLDQQQIGRKTRFLLAAMAHHRGRGLWTQEPTARTYPCYAELHHTLTTAGSLCSREVVQDWIGKSVQDAADRLAEQVKGLSHEASVEMVRRVDRHVRRRYSHDARTARLEAMEVGPLQRNVSSPSGKYRLDIYRLGKSNSRGQVFLGDRLIATVNRNYAAFPNLFVEGHEDGHDYLVCGADYQGQTVIQLDTGKRRDYLPPEAERGHGFCWAGYTYEPSQKILIVHGCYWACPYEYRFYDFSRPLNGIRLLSGIAEIDDDLRTPTLNADGSFTVYQSGDSTEDADGNDLPGPVVAWTQYKKHHGKMVKVGEWVDPEEVERRAKAKAANDAYEAWLTNFRTTDPCYLAMKAAIQAPPFKPEHYDGVGWTHANWAPDWQGNERRVCRRIHKGTPAIDLDIAVDSGPIKLVLHAQPSQTHFFPHGVEGVEQALQLARQALSPTETSCKSTTESLS